MSCPVHYQCNCGQSAAEMPRRRTVEVVSGISYEADCLRGYAIQLYKRLIAPHELTKEEQMSLERLVFELDRLCDRCEELHGGMKKTA